MTCTSESKGCRCYSTADRWYNRIRWLGPIYTAYKAVRDSGEELRNFLAELIGQ
jgi:hypothetical protein